MTQMLSKKAWGQPTTWGQALYLKTHGGLRSYVSTINSVVNSPTRPVFAKLFSVEDPSDLVKDQPYYAWLLLTVMGENPAEWGIGDDAVPGGVNVKHLKKVLRSGVRHQGLEPRTRWFGRTGERRGFMPIAVPGERHQRRAQVIPLAADLPQAA